jgi:hypothetical protein
LTKQQEEEEEKWRALCCKKIVMNQTRCGAAITITTTISPTLFTVFFATYALLIQAFVPNSAAFVGRASTSVSGTVIVEGVEFDTVRDETRVEKREKKKRSIDFGCHDSMIQPTDFVFDCATTVMYSTMISNVLVSDLYGRNTYIDFS